MEGHCHASGGRHESDCGSLGRSKTSFFVFSLEACTVEDSCVRWRVGIGNSNVEVVGNLSGSQKGSKDIMTELLRL